MHLIHAVITSSTSTSGQTTMHAITTNVIAEKAASLQSFGYCCRCLVVCSSRNLLVFTNSYIFRIPILVCFDLL